MAETKVHVVIHYSEGGSGPDIYIHGEDARVLWVDDNAPNDRVYEMLDREADLAFLDRLVPAGSEVGNNCDSRHEAIKNRILAAQDGRPALTLVQEP